LTELKKYVIECIDSCTQITELIWMQLSIHTEKRLFHRRQFYYNKPITSSRTSSSTQMHKETCTGQLHILAAKNQNLPYE